MPEYLAKLRKMVNGALALRGIPAEQRAWWDGYRQCLDDVGAELDE